MPPPQPGEVVGTQAHGGEWELAAGQTRGSTGHRLGDAEGGGRCGPDEGSGIRQTVSPSCLSLGSWANYRTTLSLCFLIWNVRTVAFPSPAAAGP